MLCNLFVFCHCQKEKMVFFHPPLEEVITGKGKSLIKMIEMHCYQMLYLKKCT